MNKKYGVGSKNGKGSADLVRPEPEVLARGTTGGGHTFLPKEILGVIQRRLLVIVLVAMAFVGMAVVLSSSQTPIYQTSIKIIVGQELGAQPTSLTADIQGLNQFAR